MDKLIKVLNKYIKFIKLYDSKLSNSKEDKAIHYKNITLLSNLNLALKKIYPNLQIQDDTDISYFEDKPLKYLDFCQCKIHNSLESNALKLYNLAPNLKQDKITLSLLCLIEFSKIKDVSKDSLKLNDVYNCLTSLSNKKDNFEKNKKIKYIDSQELFIKTDDSEIDDI